jgi:TusA-related sulfurtransferase
MLKLEDMGVGEELEVLVDYPPAVASTPRQLAAYGHHVKDIVEHRKGWLLVIRKGQPWC